MMFNTSRRLQSRRATSMLGLIFASVLVVTGSWRTPQVRAAGNGLDTRTIVVGGLQRTYHVHLPPSYTGKTALPLVVALHASHDNGPNMAGLTHFNDIADLGNVIAVYPDAVAGIWNTDSSAPQDDFAFISAMLQQIRGTTAINSHLVYAMGFSNGATFSEALGCRLSSQLAAIASVSGHMASTFPCTPVHPMPLITFHGTADTIYSYNGWGNAKYGQHLMGAVDAEDRWGTLAHCTGAPTTTAVPNTVNDGTSEQLRAIGSCTNGVQMQLYTITNGGHTWPGGMPLAYLGVTSGDIDASSLIWQFFARFRY